MRKFLIRLFVIFLSTLIVIGVLEIVARIFWEKIRGPIFPVSIEIHRVAANKKMEYELIPSSKVFLDGVWYKINQDGNRDFVYAKEKPAGAFRVAALGDSLTFGMALEFADTWPKQLERKLRQVKQEAEVINFGVMGYDTTQEAEQIHDKVLSYNPDLIIICYSLSDIGILSRERRELKQFRGYGDFLTTGIGFIDRFLKHSKLYLFIKNRLYLQKTKADQKPPAYSRDGMKVLQVGYDNFMRVGYFDPENRNRLRAAFTQIRSYTQGKAPVLVVILPELRDFENYIYQDVHEIVKTLSQENGFLFLDPLPQFLKYDADAIRISKVNCHPNRRGCDVYATAIADYLKANGLIR